jgi:cell pole-organizing protein PopZ
MMAQDSEASVEDILESIKQVIARDNRVGAMEARRRRMLVSDQPDPEPAPLARTHVVRDAEEVLDLADMECPPEPTALPLEPSDESPLIAETVRDAMQDNLAALAMLAEPGARPQIVRSGETSLEGLTRELLRPMLAEWLEANLPAMVEKLVQDEIARIVGKRR